MSDTINSLLGYFYNLLASLPFTAQNIIIASAIFLFFLLLRNICTTYIFKLVLKLFSKKNIELGKKILHSFEHPMQVFFMILGVYAALSCLQLNANQQIMVSKLFRSVIIVLITWGLYNLQDVNSILFKKVQEKVNIKIDQILFPFFSKSLRIITIIVAFTIIAQEWNYDINGLIAGLGLGGLAFALAAKDSLANIFAGIVIILDKPFSLGDSIKTSSVEGIVEDINFRSTKVRTFDQALVTVPNSTLANESITNWSKRGKRQITFNLGVSYTTPRKKLEKCVEKMRLLLENNPEVHKETIFVTLDNIGESSLNIFLYFFTITTTWGEYLRIKEDINFKILQILEEEEVAIAFPCRSIYFKNAIPRE